MGGRLSAAEKREFGWRVTSKKAIADAMGLSPSSVTTRAKTVANVLERADVHWPSVLHSGQRREAMRTREVVAEWRDRPI